MSEALNKIRDFMEKQGIPGRDGYELAASGKAFPDGANFGIEIAGVERATTMAAMIKEADRRNIVIHRAIAAVGGSTYCDFQELKDMAQLAKDAHIEVIMTVGHRTSAPIKTAPINAKLKGSGQCAADRIFLVDGG